MRRFGLPDGLGIVASLVALAWLPGAADPLTYIKLLLLIGGGLALSPAVFMRWKALGRPSWAIVAPAGAALLILVWGLISTFASGAPLWNSLFGWWGRGDGWLAWLGAVVLLLGATTLTTREVARTVTWLLGGASIVALIGLLQVAGVNIPEGAGGQVSGTMGNAGQANYSAAKAGVVGLTKTLAKEWGQFKINVNAVAFGFVETRLTASKDGGETVTGPGGEEIQLGIPDQLRAMASMIIPLGRPATPDEASGPVLFLASGLSDYVHGQVLNVTGGQFGGMYT